MIVPVSRARCWSEDGGGKVDRSPVNHHAANAPASTRATGTTASDALWMGLPLVTCPGHSFAGRMAASLLTAAGLPELTAHSLEEYEALAVKLGRDPALLAATKAKLAQNHTLSPLGQKV